MTSTPHLTAFTPSHTTRPALPPRGGRGVDTNGIPSLPDWVLRESHRASLDEAGSLFSGAELEAGEAMAEICESIKQKMAAKIGGTWTKDLR